MSDDIMTPRQFAEFLVENAPDGKWGEPYMLRITGLRQLTGYGSDDELKAAVQEFDDRLEELTGYREPEVVEIPEPPKAPPPSPPSDPRALAQEIIAGAFSAPFDGSERRLEVLAQRAWGLVEGMIGPGLSRNDVNKMIEDLKAELRAHWDRP